MTDLLNSIPYSPIATTSGTTLIDADEIVISDYELDYFPDVGENEIGVAVLSTDSKFQSEDPDDYETITYTDKDIYDNKLIGVTRGVEGTAREWPDGTVIACIMTAEHFKRINSKVSDHSARHENGGADEISLAGLQGESAELNAHKSDFMPHGIDNAGFHNSIYRGKDLGTSVTDEQYDNIANGTFKDMYIGDFWTINDTKYLIAAFNYYYNTGDDNSGSPLTQNHITLVPADTMYNHVMNDTDTTDGGYVGSKMYEEGLDAAKSTILTDFSGHVVNHRKFLSNAVSDGVASGAAWFDSEVELMNEHMVYGSNAAASSKEIDGHRHNVGVCKSQLPLFRLRHDLIGIKLSWWLRDVSSASYFAHVLYHGTAHCRIAVYSSGVRPAFSIS